MLLAVATGCLAVGLALLLAGRRGRRVDDHPVCRKCGYDLVGSPGPWRLCPECGALLFKRRAVRRGNRRRRPGAIAGGLAVLTVGVVLGAPAGYMQATQTDVYHHLPYEALRWLGLRTDSALAKTAAEELAARVAANALSDAQMDQLLADALTLQADEQRPWLEPWGDVVWDLQSAGRGTREDYAGFLRTLFETTVDVPERVERQADGSAELRIVVSTRRGRGEGDYYPVAHSWGRALVQVGERYRHLDTGQRAGRPEEDYELTLTVPAEALEGEEQAVEIALREHFVVGFDRRSATFRNGHDLELTRAVAFVEASEE